MKLEHSFAVPVPVDQAWGVLLDVERIAPCMPGATINNVDGDTFDGTVKVKVGPITVTYSGTASFVEKDEPAHRVVMRANGRETRGPGTAAATVTASLAEAEDGTTVDVETDLAITGRPAQFGRGVMNDVGAKLLGQFSDCLAAELATSQPAAAAGEEPPPQPPPESADENQVPGPPAAPRPTPDAVNLVGAAGASVAKRLVPAIVVVAILVVIFIAVL